MGLLAFLLPLAAGCCLLRRTGIVDGMEPRWARHALTAAFGIPAGIGIISTLYFLLAVLGVAASPLAVLLMNAVLAAAAAVLAWKAPAIPAAAPVVPARPGFRWNWLLALSFGVSFAFVMAGLVTVAESAPYGDWDAWSIWNLRAKFLSGLSGPFQGFTTSPYTGHGDYPLLLPGFIAQVWAAQGGTPQWVPAATGLVFLFAILALLFGVLAVLRTTSTALLAGLAALSAVSFLYLTVMQYADLPLACYYLAAVALVVLGLHSTERSRRTLALAGVFASFAAWTKNEGLLFLLVLTVCVFLLPALREGWKRGLAAAAPFALSALPVLLVTLGFKLLFAPTPDRLLRQSAEQLVQRAADAGRWGAIAKAFALEVWTFGQPWSHLLLLAILAVALRFRLEPRLATGVATAALALALVLGGYYAVYLFTPENLAWHLETSLSRLYGQLWPSFLLVFFMALRAPEE
jgi:hypothetical protein